MKVADCVVTVLNKWNSIGGEYYQSDCWFITKGDNGLFLDVYEMLKKEGKEPKYFFEKWKSNVLQTLKKDKRFEYTGMTQGWKGWDSCITMELRKEYRKVED